MKRWQFIPEVWAEARPRPRLGQTSGGTALLPIAVSTGEQQAAAMLKKKMAALVQGFYPYEWMAGCLVKRSILE
jgi:hypothetical protein